MDGSQYQMGGSSQVLIYNKQGVAIGVNRENLNALESELGTTGSPTGYSHQLSIFYSYEYYKLVGKYPQFVAGWDTFPFYPNGFVDYNNYQLPQMLWYAHQRGVANELYQTYYFFVGAIFVNHFLSILDAVWSAHTYNNRIAMNVSIQNISVAGNEVLCPTLNFSYNF
jgi:hypothetical protein